MKPDLFIFFQAILEVKICVHRLLRILKLDRDFFYTCHENILARFVSTILCMTDMATNLSPISFGRVYYDLGSFENACPRNMGISSGMERPQGAVLSFDLIDSFH